MTANVEITRRRVDEEFADVTHPISDQITDSVRYYVVANGIADV
jgi:DNA-binding cell septation regulator SpoVG